MSKIKLSFVILFAVLIGLFAFGFNSEAVFAEGEAGAATTTSDVKLPFKSESADVYKAENPTAIASDDKALTTIVNTMYTFATYLSGLIFGVSVIMIVWAGFKYATSQGEARTTETAKMQIITAGIGIGVALFAMVIVKVFAEIYGVS